MSVMMKNEKQEVQEEIKRVREGQTGLMKRKHALERLRMMSEDRKGRMEKSW